MDIKDGYFQVLLSQELSDLTSFILPAELKKMVGKFKSREISDEALFNTGCLGIAFGSQVFKCVDDAEAPGQDV